MELEKLLEKEASFSSEKKKCDKGGKVQKIISLGFELESEEEEQLYEGCARVALFKKNGEPYYLLRFSRSFLLCCDYYYSKYKGDGRYSEMNGRGETANERKR